MVGIAPDYFLDEMSQDEVQAIYHARFGIKKKTAQGPVKKLTQSELMQRVQTMRKNYQHGK